MNTQHTPTPYVVDSSRRRTRIRIGTENGCPVVTVDCASANTAEAKATAAFIVRACNAHDELVAALKGLLDDMRDIRGIDPEEYKPESFAAARAALANVGDA